ncbi:hypothetical protein [Thermus aquaticus]|uniref:hypothetical protein n=1 Tax=Thermus aquaticus TaxID=271 RepID=UPI00017E6983|nr:hypothetical protein [Thermus aquaticus]
MEDPKALLKDPLAYVARRAEAWAKPLKGAWLLGVASGFLWPEAPPPKDAAALFRRLEGAWRESEAYFLDTGLDFPLLVSEWAREALEPTFRTPFTPAGNIARPPGGAPRSRDGEPG